METLIDGVLKVVPEPSDEPALIALNQLTVPALEVAFKPTLPGPHLCALDTPVIVGNGLTVATTAVRGDEHPLPSYAATE